MVTIEFIGGPLDGTIRELKEFTGISMVVLPCEVGGEMILCYYERQGETNKYEFYKSQSILE